MLFDTARTHDHIDTELTFVHELLSHSLGPLLGSVGNQALTLPDENILTLSTLASLLCTTGSIATDPAKLDLHALMYLPCMKARFPAGEHAAVARPYSCKAGLDATIELAANFFELLGVPDDDGKAIIAPFSPRAVWNLCLRFLRDYGASDMALVSSVAEATILGVVSDFFTFHFDPMRGGRCATSVCPTALVTSSSAHIDALHRMRTKLHSRAERSSSDHVSIDDLPGVKFLTPAAKKQKGGVKAKPCFEG